MTTRLRSLAPLNAHYFRSSATGKRGWPARFLPGTSWPGTRSYEPAIRNTSHVQPLDAGRVRCCKARFRSLVLSRQSSASKQVTKSSTSSINSRQWSLSRRRGPAVASISASIISKCWRQTRILSQASRARELSS
ncbi:hypothetical protein V8E36_002949 [Tilletia maclaganii]